MTVELWHEIPSSHHVLGEEQFGWRPEFAGQLVRYALQPRMRELVPEDYTDQFASQRSVNEWYRQNFDSADPMIAWLADSSLKLAGIAWITKDHSFGLRVYEGYQRATVGTQLAVAIHEKSDAQFPSRQTHFTMLARNTGAFVIGSVKLGYQLQHTPTDKEQKPTSRIPTGNLQQKYIRKLSRF